MPKQRLMTGGLIIGCIALLAALIFYFMENPEVVVGTLRFLLIVVFTVLPAGMYYVFIASRKSSLFQEYVTNLYRFGLLNNLNKHTRPAEGIDERYIYKMRLQSYILRFEGVYGAVNEPLTRELSIACKADYPLKPAAALPQASDDLKLNTRHHLISTSTAVPVLIATFLIGVCWLLLLPPWPLTTIGSQDSTPPIAVLEHAGSAPLFGFLGAYFFSLQLLFRRFVTADLRAGSYVSFSIRIVLAIIGAWTLQALLTLQPFNVKGDSPVLLVCAFIVGAFPPVLWRLIRQAASKFPGIRLAVPSMNSRLPASELDGLTVWHQTRLEEEDVENTFNMANADIIDLLVNTKIPPERIVDWVDQAILYSVISQHDKSAYQGIKHALSRCGIRTATMLDQILSSGRLETNNGSAESKTTAIANAHLYQQAVSGFSNYQLIKNWRGHTYQPDVASSSA
ncbi:MAG: hypothetical protein AB8B63_18840 [Granulosicoccus sp.]